MTCVARALALRALRSPRPRPPGRGLALGALILGVMSFCGGLTAIPGIIVGVVGLRSARPGRHRLTRALAWLGIAASCAGIAFMLFIAIPTIYEQTCLANEKQMALNLLMYANDHDEKLPPAKTWTDGLTEYTRNELVFVCPSRRRQKCGYAFNRALSGVKLAEVPDPQNTVLMFESDLGWNGSGDRRDAVWPLRHWGVNIAFVDGHARTCDRARLRQLVWDPSKAQSPGR